MYWLIGIFIIFIFAFVIIKLSIDTKKNPDSNLGILDHPSAYKKQNIEMVDKSLKQPKSNNNQDQDTKVW